MPNEKIDYVGALIFMGMPRCKKRAHGAGTTSPPNFPLIIEYII